MGTTSKKAKFLAAVMAGGSLFVMTPAAFANADSKVLPDGCWINRLNGWSGSSVYAQTYRQEKCIKWKAEIHYQNSSGVWTWSSSQWVSSGAAAVASPSGVRTYDKSRHWGDNRLSDCCTYWADLSR